MAPVDIYIASRTRLIELAPTLSDEQLIAPLAATPPWVLSDAYRHLAGVCSDVLDGAMENAGSPEWTTTQIVKRGDMGVADVCAEWAGRAPQLDAIAAAAGTSMAFLAFDAWTHEQDVRAAAGLGGARDELATALAAIAVESFRPRYAKAGAPVLRIDLGGETVVLGDDDSASAGAGASPSAQAVTLRTTPYELLRMIFGRRSRPQMQAADWSGTAQDRDAVIDALHLFPMPVVDIDD